MAQRVQLGRIEIEPQIAMHIRAIGGQHRLFADADLAGDEPHGFCRIVICPLGNPLNGSHQFRHQIRPLIGKGSVHRQGTRRAIVDANFRIGMKPGRYDDLRADEIGDGDTFGTLDEKRIDLAAVQCCNFSP